jgi:multidrug efflux system membrane fusion protein
MKFSLVFLLLIAAVQAAPTAAPPATLSKEGDLTTVVLTPEAEARLRLQIVPVERQALPATRLFSGEIILSLAAPGQSLAPVLGGSLAEQLQLANQQAVADGNVSVAKAQFHAAALAVERAEKVRLAEAGSARAVEEAAATHALAITALRTAQIQRELLGQPIADASRSTLRWVRVAVYNGETTRIDDRATALIRPVSATQGGRPASPIPGPATANASAHTVDWYYELTDSTGLRLGERVAVELPLRDSATPQLTVPTHAILTDIHGGQWVYRQSAPHTYVRQRIEVARIAGKIAVLARGPAVGTPVVTDGSAELFGTEFLTGK